MELRIKRSAVSELRQDLVSGDWILLAPERASRPELFAKGRRAKISGLKNCPFENPQKFGNQPPSLVYQKPDGQDWFLQVIENKFPAVGAGRCGIIENIGPYSFQDGTGRHEVIILRDHARFLSDYHPEEIKRLLEAYIDRLKTLSGLPCIEYISIFHNHGKEAGASVLHPHSQALALPVVPPDIKRSLAGSTAYFHKYKKCVHCQMIEFEIKNKERLIYENKSAVVFSPFASRNNFEVRIFPKKHRSEFGAVEKEELIFIAEALKVSLAKISFGLKDPAFNMFLHTVPCLKPKHLSHYHWHFEILPKLSHLGGFELGTGIDIITLAPEKAAEYLRKVKISDEK